MALRHAIESTLLVLGEASGYDLSKEFDGARATGVTFKQQAAEHTAKARISRRPCAVHSFSVCESSEIEGTRNRMRALPITLLAVPPQGTEDS